jgi:hypothetical protein
MLCFGTYGEFTTGGFFNEGLWKQNPYNAANGGPCAKPEEFWTNPQARALYRQRLRYIAARYGYRTGIQAWEFWNETNAPAPWVQEMASYLKGTGPYAKSGPADPFGHLVTTTYGDDAVWKLPEIDFTQSHHYGEGNIPDHAPIVHDDAQRYLAYGKPHLMAEFGIDWRDADRKYDPGGKAVNFHNGLWAGALSGDAGGAMLWWWDNYVHPLSLYAPFGPLRRFTDAVAWTEGKVDAARRGRAAHQGGRGDLHRPDAADRKPVGQGGRCGVPADAARRAGGPNADAVPLRPGEGRPADDADVPRGLREAGPVPRPRQHGLELRTSAYPAGRSAVWERRLTAAPSKNGDAKPEYAQTEYRKEYNVYQARFNKEYAIEGSGGRAPHHAGEHGG